MYSAGPKGSSSGFGEGSQAVGTITSWLELLCAGRKILNNNVHNIKAAIQHFK